FDSDTQVRALTLLRHVLKPEGILFVGASETAAVLDHDFVSLGVPRAFGFRKIDHAKRHPTKPVRAMVGRHPGIAVQPLSNVAAARSAEPGRRLELPAVASAMASTPEQTLIDQAERLADEGRFPEAADRCEQHLRRFGPSASAFYLLGLVRDA